MSDVLKKPVHIVLVKDSNIQRITKQKNLIKTETSLTTPEQVKLPKEVAPSKVPQFNPLQGLGGPNLIKQANLKTRLNIIYDQVPPLATEKVPPCDSCVSACCYAFIVEITKEEYESGNYGDSAIKLDSTTAEQFKDALAPHYIASLPHLMGDNADTRYLLEGSIGQPCPFLFNSRCGIYNIRPMTCRIYSCVDDERITQGMRDGTEPIDPLGKFLK